MTEKDMCDLLRSYDALRDLRKTLGVDDIALGIDTLIERLDVSGIICRHAKGWNGDVAPWMMRVLEDRESSLEERARRLMGTG